MARFFALVSTFFFFCTLQAQRVENLPARTPKTINENVVVEQIATDSLCTTFVLWIKGGVKHHFHQSHTECIYILEGTGEMSLADSTFTIKAGDYILVPKGTLHAVTAAIPLKVLSIQTPQWVADDRKFVEPFRRPHNE